MDEVKTIDPRGLEHSEREALIFPSIEGIRKDETLRIVMEVLKETREAKRIEVKAPHPVHSFMEEHKIILENLNQLDSVVER
jgi:uncharacterized protein (DUF2249 family)